MDGIELRMPYQSGPITRAKINAGEMEYLDVHLSHVAQMAWEGVFGRLDFAVIEIAGVTEDGQLIPSSSMGINKTWLDVADRVILEVRLGQLPKNLLPLQSGVGNIANAVLARLEEGPFQQMNAYTEVIQDGMLQMLCSGASLLLLRRRSLRARKASMNCTPILTSTANELSYVLKRLVVTPKLFVGSVAWR